MSLDKRTEQLEQINILVLELASGNFNFRINTLGENDELDSIVTGINMLGEELQASTVSLNYLNSIYKGIVDMCIVLDPEHVIISINEKVRTLLQYEEKELIGKPISFICDSIYATSDTFSKEILEKEGFYYNIERNFKAKNGATIPVSCSGSLLYDNKKRVSGILYIAKDVSVQKKNEEELKKSKELIELALRASNDGIWDWDLTNHQFYFSPRWKEMLGYADDEFLNSLEAWEDSIFPEDKEIALQRLDEYNEGKVPEFKEIQRYYHKNGQTLYILSRCIHQKDESGRVTRMIWAHTDITFQKQAELDLQIAKEQAEAANMAKSLFLTNMSHEIRTPLNAILGFTNHLLGSALSDDQRKFLSLIDTSGKNLSKLLCDILDLSKIETGKLELDYQEFNFRDSISSTLEPYKFIANDKRLAFELTFDESIPTGNIISDPLRINQVIINLVANSIKFTKEGSIKVNFAAKEDPSLKEDEVFIEVKVTDTGLGIPAEKKDVIFERFNQADNSVTRKYGGSGLGLTIVRQMVHLLGGEVDFKSPAPGTKQGTEFTFLIKIKLIKEIKQNRKIKTSSGDLFFNKVYKVLVVEDNEMNQILAMNVLQDIGIEAILVENGLEAVEKVDREDFDLILMDIQMPVMNGIEATKLIRAKKFRKPILALSANVGTEDIGNCFEAGMNLHIAKPFTKEEIFDALSRFLED